MSDLRTEQPLYTYGQAARLRPVGVLLAVSLRRGRGLPMQRIRPAVKVLQERIGLDHALASRNLYSDGAEILFDFADRLSASRCSSTGAPHAPQLYQSQGFLDEFMAVLDISRVIVTGAPGEEAAPLLEQFGAEVLSEVASL